MRKIILFDIDKTVYDDYTIFPLAKSQLDAQLLDQTTVTQLDQDMTDYKAGKHTYEQFVATLLDHWADGLKGKSYQIVLDHTVSFFNGNLMHFYAYVASVFAKFSESHDIFFVTGEPQFIAEAIRMIYQAKGTISSIFEIDQSGIFTGKVNRYLSTKTQKREALSKTLEQYRLEQSVGFGDSEADIFMLELMANRFCISPNAALLAHAEAHGWNICAPDDVMNAVTVALS